MTIAQQVAAIRALLPTTLGSYELRTALAEDLRARSVFVSRASNVVFLSKVKEMVELLAAGEIDQASARLALKETLQAIGYTPEEGFPEVEPGEVPPALAGTLQDISSTRRLDLILDTQVQLVRGRGQQLRGMQEGALDFFPAWELTRWKATDIPRDWPSRWLVAGGTLTSDGRMIAFKGDPIWGELGSSSNFDDALDVDFPPFAFNSGMGWSPIEQSEIRQYGITGPHGETVEEWLKMDHKFLLDDPGLPVPQVSMRGVDQDLTKEWEATGEAKVVGTTATTPDGADEIERRIAEIDRRRKQRMEDSLAARDAEYKPRNQ
jgi:hypothetical protein